MVLDEPMFNQMMSEVSLVLCAKPFVINFDKLTQFHV